MKDAIDGVAIRTAKQELDISMPFRHLTLHPHSFAEASEASECT